MDVKKVMGARGTTIPEVDILYNRKCRYSF